MLLSRLQEWYEHDRDQHGTSVEEWEDLMGLPPFSVYPNARYTWHSNQIGFFMYSPEKRLAALAEESRQVECLRALGVSRDDIAMMFRFAGYTLAMESVVHPGRGLGRGCAITMA